jgi:hypothetical protein
MRASRTGDYKQPARLRAPFFIAVLLVTFQFTRSRPFGYKHLKSKVVTVIKLWHQQNAVHEGASLIHLNPISALALYCSNAHVNINNKNARWNSTTNHSFRVTILHRLSSGSLPIPRFFTYIISPFTNKKSSSV